MINERTQLIIRLVSTHLILVPVLILPSLLINRDAYLILSISQSLILILFLTGYWEFFGIRFRMIYSFSMEILLLAAFAWKINSPFTSGRNLILITFLGVIQAYLFLELIKIFIVIFRQEKNKFEISFPFRQGIYLITDGGNSKISRLMNYHFYSTIHKKNKTNYSMLFATDIVRIDKKGKKFLPARNEDYPIFGEKVFSPVSGEIFKVVNNIDDNTPYCGGYPYNTGNTIVIRSENKYMLLGHLKKDSIRVNVGDLVSENEVLAEAGNSGFSERAHLHIQLIDCISENYWKGRGVSISFIKKNLFKNRIIEVE